MATERRFRQANLAAGAGTRVPNGTKFNVTYADDGTETWIWRGFMSASNVPEIVMSPTGNITRSDGVVKPKACANG